MELGQTLPIWSIIPFAGMLLSIAIFPLVRAEWWEKHQLLVALAWALLFLVPFVFAYGAEVTAEQLAEVVIGDYIPFIVLLLGLYVVAGGIHVGGTIAGTTRNNVVMLLIGTLLASWVGTTGAAMLLIRPLLRANLWRKYRAHIVVFFIFLVANAGGCLTPLGDPPLFLGYLRGVPFFWTLQHIWPLLLVNTVLLIGLFVVVDRYFTRREPRESREKLELLSRRRRPRAHPPAGLAQPVPPPARHRGCHPQRPHPAARGVRRRRDGDDLRLQRLRGAHRGGVRRPDRPHTAGRRPVLGHDLEGRPLAQQLRVGAHRQRSPSFSSASSSR